MKKIFSIAILLISLNSFGQITSEIDKFTGKKRVESEWQNIYTGFGVEVKIKFRAVDTTYFLSIAGNVGVGVIGTNDGAIFLFEDTTKFEIFPTSMQTYEIQGAYASKYYNHQYRITRDQLWTLSTKRLSAVRRTFNSNYADIDVKDRLKGKIQGITGLFMAALPNY